MPLKYACTFAFKKSRQLKVNNFLLYMPGTRERTWKERPA